MLLYPKSGQQSIWWYREGAENSLWAVWFCSMHTLRAIQPLKFVLGHSRIPCGMPLVSVGHASACHLVMAQPYGWQREGADCAFLVLVGLNPFFSFQVLNKRANKPQKKKESHSAQIRDIHTIQELYPPHKALGLVFLGGIFPRRCKHHRLSSSLGHLNGFSSPMWIQGTTFYWIQVLGSSCREPF